MSANGDLYVAHFDFADNADNGRIARARRNNLIKINLALL